MLARRALQLAVARRRLPELWARYSGQTASVSSQSVAVKKVPAATVKRPRQTKSRADEPWKLAILDELQGELKEVKAAGGKLSNIRQSSAQLIRYAVDDDALSIISYMHSFLLSLGRNKKSKIPYKIDEFLSVCQILVNRNMEGYLSAKADPNDRTATSICYAYGNLLKKLRFIGPDTRISTLLLYETFNKWSHQRKKDEHSAEIRQTIEEMEDRISDTMGHISFAGSSLILNETDHANLRRVADAVGVKLVPKEIDSLGYDPNLELAKPLQTPCDSEDYAGNPFAIEGATKEHYMSQFEKQIALEESPWIKIDNFWKNRSPDVETSAEQLIDNWEWRRRIEEQLTLHAEKHAMYPLKSYLAVLDRKELVDALLQAMTANCSMGQNLIPVAVFQHSLTAPVLRLIHAKFVSKLGVDVNAIWKQIFSEYLTYFENDEVARTHTHRQWWSKVCHRNGVPPEYEAPFSFCYGDMREQLSTFFTKVIVDACVFPGKGKHGRKNLLPGFSVQNIAIEEESRITEDGRVKLAKMVQLETQMMAAFEKHQFNHILFPTGELPMTVPPRPWVDLGVGGPEFTRSKQVLRKLSEYKMIDINEEMTSRLSPRSQGRPIFDALNQLGSTPWIINEPMLNVLSEVFAKSNDSAHRSLLDTLSVPLRAASVKIPTVEEVLGENADKETVPKEKWVEFYKAKNEAIKTRNEMNSLWYWMMYRVVLARHFKGHTLFFPHNMDFRGRVYPISPYLNHMGDDVNRCILKFAKGKPLGETGLSWLKLHCINLTGKLKRQSVAERLRVAEEELPLMLDSADHPLDGKKWWLESEEPWQTLAACMELRDALAFPGDPADFVSHLPVHQDGSCNGLQHYAALGRDKQGGNEVNLLPSELPNDVYSSVAVRVEQKRRQDEESGEDMELAQRLRQAMPQAVPRKVIKQTVMTTVYGVTMYGAVLQIKRQLKALGIDNDDTAKFATYLALKTFASLNDAFTSSMQLKDWFRTCAKGTNELMRTVEWVTPLGLPVVQPYVRDKIMKGRLVLAPITTKQIDAFPPNFVHSLDSTHMMLTSLQCSRNGVTFAAVHDCFWTHASTVDTMNEICRQQFVELHSQPIVEQLSDYFLGKYLPPSVLSSLPEDDKKRYMALFTPKVKPGDLDIKDVINSVYFFS